MELIWRGLVRRQQSAANEQAATSNRPWVADAISERTISMARDEHRMLMTEHASSVL